jgi:hypothetical protein
LAEASDMPTRKGRKCGKEKKNKEKGKEKKTKQRHHWYLKKHH